MNITFFIGNGFDLSLKVKTGYADFLADYIKKKHEGALSENIMKEYDSWANLEKQLGIYAGSVKAEDADKFNAEKETLEDDLREYLGTTALADLEISKDGADEFRDMVTGFSRYLPAAEQDHYKNIVAGTKEAINYWFVNFNYTYYLDDIIEEARKIDPFGMHAANGTNYADKLSLPIHIHGELEDLLLGVNDKSQIGDGKNEPIPEIADYLIKPVVNNKLGNQKISSVQGIINRSKYVCVFGMSLGITDKDWWCYLGNWLNQSPDRRLVLFIHDDTAIMFSSSKKARKADLVRMQFIEKIEAVDKAEQLNKQIVVVFNSGIFDFTHISTQQTNEGEEGEQYYIDEQAK